MTANWPGWFPPAMVAPGPAADWALHLGLLAVVGLAARGLGGLFVKDEPFRLGLGWAMVSYAMLGLGAIGALTRPAAWTVVVVGAAANFRPRRHDVPGQEAGRVEPLGWSGWTGVLLMAVAAVLAALRAMSPPFGMDQIGYHLNGPARFAAEGRLLSWPEEPNTFLCGVQHLGYVAALLLLDDRLAALLHLGMAGLSTAAVVRLAGRWTPRGAAWLVGGLWAATPFVVMLGGMATSDLALAAYLGLAVLAVAQDRWALAGVCAGLAAAVRPQGVVVPALLAASVVIVERARGVRRRLPVFLGAALLVALPWFIKNLVFTGSPVYPFASALCRTPDLKLGAEEIVDTAYTHQPSWRAPWRVIGWTWAQAFHDPDRMGMPLVAWTVVLGAGLGAWAAWRGPGGAGAGVLWITAVLGLVVWQVTGARPRYLVPWAALFCVLAAPALRRRAPAVLAAAAGLASLVAAARQMPPGAAAAALGRMSPAQYLTARHPEFAAVFAANDGLPQDAKVITAGVMRWYYLRRPALVHSGVGPSPFLRVVREARTAGEVAERLKSIGITHVFLAEDWLEFHSRANRVMMLSDDERRRIAELVRRHTAPLLRRGPVALLRLT